MDPIAISALAAAGASIDLDRELPVIPIACLDDGEAAPADGEVAICVGKSFATVKLGKISELWKGSAQPPSFAQGPTPEYLRFFMLIELTAIDYCVTTRRVVTDQEFERLYNHLRRRPDGTDAEPLFSYLQAAVRLYMSLRDVSQAEFEAVVKRLAHSAQRYSAGYASRNYVEVALRPLLDARR